MSILQLRVCCLKMIHNGLTQPVSILTPPVVLQLRSITSSVTERGSETSADLEIQEICEPEMSVDEDKADLESGLKSMAKGMGIDVGDDEDEEESMDSYEDDEDEDETEEK